MRTLSLSFLAVAVLSIAPVSQAQQAAQIRKANQAQQAGVGKSMAPSGSKAKAFARYQAWQQSQTVKQQGHAGNGQGLRQKAWLSNSKAGGSSGVAAPVGRNIAHSIAWKSNRAQNPQSGMPTRQAIYLYKAWESKGVQPAKAVKSTKVGTSKSLKAEFGKRHLIKQAVKAALKSGHPLKLKGKLPAKAAQPRR